jgi:uncharacterized protein YcbX
LNNIFFKRCKGFIYPDYVNNWFSKFAGVQVFLIRNPPKSQQRKSGERSLRSDFKRTGNSNQISTNENEKLKTISFSNESQFLLVSNSSVEYLSDIINDNNIDINAISFRPNFVVKGSIPYEEDNWNQILIGNQKFKVLI